MDDLSGLRQAMAETHLNRPDLARQLMDIASSSGRTAAQRSWDMAKAKLGAVADATTDLSRRQSLRGAVDMMNTYGTGATISQRGQMMKGLSDTFGLNSWTGKTLPPISSELVGKSWDRYMNPTSRRTPLDVFNSFDDLED